MSAGIGEDRFLTVREVAQKLRVSTATVYKLCATGRIENIRALNVIRVSRRALQDLSERG